MLRYKIYFDYRESLISKYLVNRLYPPPVGTSPKLGEADFNERKYNLIN